MKAAIRGFHSPDIWDLELDRPSDEDTFGILLQVLIGPEGQVGEESFDVIVCTPSWLESRLVTTPVVLGTHHLIVTHYDFEAIKTFVHKTVDSLQADTWPELALKIGRLGKWEFDDYQIGNG